VNFEAAPANSPATWAWDFGDGSTSTLQNPAHTYTISDSYTVSLTVTGTGGSVQIIKNGYINVWFCGTSPVRNEQTRDYYNSIQNAYNSLPIFGGVIQIQALEFTENLTFDHQLLIALDGGYNCDFMSNPGFSTINGTVIIRSDAVIMENLIIK
jgi:PKD repeat protein